MEAQTIRNIFCIGRNYAEHAKELGNPVPERPVVFLKPTGSFVFSPASLSFPANTGRLDPEVEVVVVIGKDGSAIPEKRALEWVRGYAVGLDFTARDAQSEAKAKGLPWLFSKGRKNFAPVSKVISTTDSSDIRFSLHINGEKRQSASTREMIFSIPRIIAYLSEHYGLERGDLIFTGTPAGVGPVRAGDVLVAELTAGNEKVRMETRISELVVGGQ